MVEFLVTKGKLVVRNGEPLIVMDGEEKGVSKSEFILWTSLHWNILNKESLEKEFDRRMKKYGIDSDTSFEYSIAQFTARSSSGSVRRPLKAEITGSNPVRATKIE